MESQWFELPQTPSLLVLGSYPLVTRDSTGAAFRSLAVPCVQAVQVMASRGISAADLAVKPGEPSATSVPTGRNTEILTFNDDRIIGAEVYFGWDLQ